MKKNLLKSALLALMVLIGGSAWADETNLNPVGIFSWTNSPAITYDATAESWAINQGGISGGKIGKFAGPYAIVKFDASTILENKTLTSAKLDFDVTAGGYNSSINIAQLSDASFDPTTVTTETFDASATQFQSGDWTTKNQTTHFSYEVKDRVAASNEIAFAIYTNTGREQTLKNVKLVLQYAAGEISKYNYSLKAVTDADVEIKTLAEGEEYETNSTTVFFPYMFYNENKLYATTQTPFNVEFNKDNTSAKVTYAEADSNIMKYMEGEDINSGSSTNAAYSNGKAGYVGGNKTQALTTLPAGNYTVTIYLAGNGNRSIVIRNTENEDNKTNTIVSLPINKNSAAGIYTSEEFVINKETAIGFSGYTTDNGGVNQSADFDYIFVTKTGDYVITPAYGKIWENGETTTDENQNTIAEVSAAYFNDFAKAKDTVRVAVEVTSPSVPSAPARNIAKGSISAFAGPDNIFAKTGIELGADTIDIILTDDALAKIKEAESLKFVYTNLTLKSIELIEAVADSAVLAEQAKLQDEITKAEGMLADENKTNGKDEFLTAINAAKALLTSIDIDAIKAGITALQTAEQTFIKANYFIDIAAGQYYIIDTKTGKFIAAGHNYGTRGIVNTIGLDLTITPNTESRKVTIDTRIANEGNHFLGTNLYMDAVVAEWALEYRGFGFWITNGTQYISIDENDNLVMSDEPREWIIVTPEGVKEQRMEDMATATKDAPKDATWAIQCANFNRNDQRISAWKVSEDCTNKNLSGGSDDNRCAESWHSTFTISQTLTGMPKGVYALTAQGFYRQDGDNTEATPVFFANEETGAVSAKTGNEDNMNDASASFSAGNYTINPIYVEVGNDSTLKVGIKGTATSQWVIFDNFQLKYYGSEVSIDELKNAAIYAEMLALREQLKNIKPEVEIQVIKDSIDNVLNSTENPEGAEAINNTIVSLKAVLEVAQAYVRVKTILPNMNQLTESTNFYTEEALNQYYTQWVAKYQNGTLTKDEADALKDPFLIAGWRSANTIDDLLMSVWDENPENWESYHVNNWSTEGGTDGTNFVVPFIEYWTGDANNLAPKTLTATINNLEQGNYQVSVRVRVRVKDGANDPTGITMTVNDELPTNVCAGTQVGETQFYMDEFTAVGDVYSDGVLKFKFNVLDGNNISWLAFKDVVYTRLSDVVGIAGVKSENKLDGTVYNLNGQKVEKAQRGLYIMNGKKVVVK